MKPGRNDPCPCGSGKKYKHCCLDAATQASAAESIGDLTWNRLRRANQGFPKDMSRFVAQVYGLEAIEEAWQEFTLWQEEAFDPDSPHVALFLPWFYHHWQPDPLEETVVEDAALHGRTPTSLFLERRAGRMDALQRRYLQACLAAPFSFHEILRCDPDHGFHTLDLITGSECEVLERMASRTLTQGDILFAQIVPTDGICLLEACPQMAIPPIHKLEIIDLRKKIAPAPTSELFGPELLREWDIELRSLYHEIIDAIMDPPRPRLQNTDGEPIVLQRLTFDIDSTQSTFEALQHLAVTDTAAEILDSADRAADGTLTHVQFDWTKRRNRVNKGWDNTILGHIEITAERLLVNVNSDERAAAFLRIAKRVLGKTARYRGSEPVAGNRIPTDEAAADAEQARLAELPEVRAKLNEILVAHYENWATENIPALGNRRPIDAVKDADGRQKVEALLQQMERDMPRLMPAGDPVILRRLRERLGLATGNN